MELTLLSSQVHEVPHYCQDDLVRDNAFILDAYDTVFVWLGILVTAKETKMVMHAFSLVVLDSSARS